IPNPAASFSRRGYPTPSGRATATRPDRGRLLVFPSQALVSWHIMNTTPSTSRPIYLDYNATTPLDSAVLDAMLPYLRDHFGNASSAHAYGKTAHNAVAHARQQAADLIGAHPDEIIFTSGGTEASNFAIKGAVFPKLGSLVGRLLAR